MSQKDKKIALKFTNEQIKTFILKPLFNNGVLTNKDLSYPKISIVIPSYNQGKFLERAILSVLNQNYPNLECILIDGGSADESLEIIKKYKKYFAYWVSKKDKGLSDALNKGFGIVSGDIMGWLNSDDIYLPGVFFQVAKLFKINHETEIIYGNRFDIDKNDIIIDEARFTKFSSIVYKYGGMVFDPQSTFWKKSLFSKIGMFDLNLRFAMDYEFFLRAVFKKIQFKYVPYFFSAMRYHEKGNTMIFLGTSVHQQEGAEIFQRYGQKKWLKFPFQIYSLLFRSINYLCQGDWEYVFKGLKRRIKNKSILSGR